MRDRTGAFAKHLLVMFNIPNGYAFAVRLSDMGDRACYREYCPACDRQVTIVDDECPECGAALSTEES